MRKYVLVPDSFKGTLSAIEVCRIMAKEIAAADLAANVVALPIADGGEGTVDCFLEALGGQRQQATVCGPLPGATVDAAWGLLPGGTAVVEMAAAAGLPLAGDKPNPEAATTYGVGQLLLEAAAAGPKEIIVGLGGSATNDGGCGMAAALGVRFLNRQGKAFVPTGGSLGQIDAIDPAGLDVRLKKLPIIAMCDVDNPMVGPRGAAAVFAPQKGADDAMVARLEDGLLHLAGLMERDLGARVSALPGGGAAGALGAGMVAFLQAQLKSGIQTVLDTVGFESKAAGAAMVLTGEGRLDSQSLGGKVVSGVAKRGKALGVPVIAVVGGIGDGIEALYEQGLTGAISINRNPQDFSVARHHAAENLRLTMRDFMRIYRGLAK